MEKRLEAELERTKLTNYILKKENELLLGTIGSLAKEKKELLEKIKIMEQREETFAFKVKRKIINAIKKIIGRK